MSEPFVDTSVTVACAPLRPVISVTPSSTIADCARVAARTDADLLVVETQPLTAVTREALAEAIVSGVDVDASIVALAATPVHTALHHSLADVVRVMAIDRVRAVLVVDDGGELAGVLSLADAVAALVSGPQWLGALRVALHIEATP